MKDNIPLTKNPRLSEGSRGTFKEQNLLIVDKKTKFVPAANEDFNGGQEGVLSIPPEDPPNNCKSRCLFYVCLTVLLTLCFCRMLLVHLLLAILPDVLLPLLERKRVCSAQA